MKAYLAREQERSRRRRRHVPLLGVSLALIQGLLVLGWTSLQPVWPPAWGPFVALILIFYLFIPAVEGFLMARPRGPVSASYESGCLVGGIGFLVLAVGVIAVVQVTYPCPPGVTCDNGYEPVVAIFFLKVGIAGNTALLLVGEGLVGVTAGTLGGWIGGVLGKKHARALQARQRGGSAADDAPARDDPGQGAIQR